MSSHTKQNHLHVKRLRIFAGPNGSGKSSLRIQVGGMGIPLYKWLNADDILKDFRAGEGRIRINQLLDQFNIGDFKDFYSVHPLVREKSEAQNCFSFITSSGELEMSKNVMNDPETAPYAMSVLVDYLG